MSGTDPRRRPAAGRPRVGRGTWPGVGAVGHCARLGLRRHWRAHLAVVLLITVVGGTVLAVTAGAHRTSTAYDRFIDYSRPPDALALVGDDVGDDDGGPRLAQVEALPQVDELAVVHQYAVVGPEPSVYVPVVASVDGRFGATVLRPRVLDGRLADPDRADEVTVNENQSRLLGVGVGDTLRLRSYATDQMDAVRNNDQLEPAGPELRLSVVGLTRSAGDVGTVDDDGAVLVLTPAFDRAYRDRTGSYDGELFAATLRHGNADVAPFTAAVRDIYRDGPAPQFQPINLAGGAVRSSLRVLAGGLVLFAIAAGVAGLVALALVTSRQVDLDRPDDLVRRDLGMTQPARVVTLVLPRVAAAAVGALGAVLVAVAASGRFPIGLGRVAEPDPGLAVDTPVLALGSVLVVLLVVGIASLLSWRVVVRSHRTPELDRRPARTRSLVAWVADLGVGPSGVTGVRMATQSGRGRTAVRPAMVGAAVGISGIVAALVFGATLDQLVTSPGRWGWNWDVVVTGSPATRHALRAHHRDVDAVAVGHFVKVLIAGHAADSVAFEPVTGSIGPTIVAGREPRAADEVALGAVTMARDHAGIGDSVVAQGPDGPTPLRVVGQAVFSTVDDPVALADGAALSVAGIERLDDPSDDEGYQRLLVRWAPGVDRAASERWLAQAAGERPQENRLPIEVERLIQVDRLPELLAAFLVVLATVAVANNAAATGIGRRRELGVLATIGFTPGQLRSALTWQAATVGAVGLVLGVPTGMVIGRLAWSATADGVGVAPDVVAPLSQLLAALVVALVLIATTGLLVGARIAHRRPAVALRAE